MLLRIGRVWRVVWLSLDGVGTVYGWCERLLNVRNHVHDRLFGIPDAIVVGEHHDNMSHAHTIAALIKKYRPEYVLMEALNDKTPEELREFVEQYKVRTLEDICGHHGVSLEKLGIGKDIVYEIRENIGSVFLKKVAHYRDDLRKDRDEAVALADDALRVEGRVPRNPEELKKTPLYLMHPVALNVLQNKIASSLSKCGDSRDTGKLQATLQHLRKHVRTGSRGDIIKRRRYDIIMSAVADVGAKVAGCDIRKPNLERIWRQGVTEALLNKISPIYRPLVRQLVRKHKLSKANSEGDCHKYREFVRELCAVLRPMRDHTMFRSIMAYTRMKTSDAPVLAVVGSAHIPGICKKLKKAKVRHRVLKLPPIADGSVYGSAHGNL